MQTNGLARQPNNQRCYNALARIEERIDSLAGSKYFRILDLSSGYWQVGIKEAEN